MIERYKYLAVALVCFACGFFVSYKFFPRIETETLVKTETKEVPVKANTSTTVTYVPKPTGSKAAVNITTEPPKVVTTANGKDYEFTTLPEETTAFEKGQLKIDTASTTKIDISKIVNDQYEASKKPNELQGGAIVGANNQYLGFEYKAKMWNAGYYRKIHGDGDRELYKIGFTVAKW